MGNGTGSRLKRIYAAAYEFLTEKWIATHEEAQASRLHHFAHFWLVVFKSFARNKCPLRATALAYTTLLAIVPLLALGVSISSSLLQGDEGKNLIKKFIDYAVDYAAPQLDLVTVSDEGSMNTGSTNAAPKISGREKVATDIYHFVDNISTGTLGVTGMIGLIVIGIMLLSTLEATFNDIWGVTRGRSWFARTVQYWAVISLGPFIVLLAVALVGGPHLQTTRTLLKDLPLLEVIFRVFPFMLISLGFALLYKLMPNTEVHWRAALLAGVVGGCVWLLQTIVQAMTVSSVVSKTSIYGNLAVVPIFLLGLYFSWLILLFGAQVAYALQNRQVYLQEKKADSVNQRGREFVALRLMTLVADRFEHKKSPPTVLEIATELGIPSRLVTRIVPLLLEARLLVEVSGEEMAYAPARPLAKITTHDILHSLRTGGGQELKTRDGAAGELVRSEFYKIQEAEKRVASSITLEDLVHQIPAEKPSSQGLHA